MAYFHGLCFREATFLKADVVGQSHSHLPRMSNLSRPNFMGQTFFQNQPGKFPNLSKDPSFGSNRSSPACHEAMHLYTPSWKAPNFPECWDTCWFLRFLSNSPVKMGQSWWKNDDTTLEIKQTTTGHWGVESVSKKKSHIPTIVFQGSILILVLRVVS